MANPIIIRYRTHHPELLEFYNFLGNFLNGVCEKLQINAYTEMVIDGYIQYYENQESFFKYLDFADNAFKKDKLILKNIPRSKIPIQFEIITISVPDGFESKNIHSTFMKKYGFLAETSNYKEVSQNHILIGLNNPYELKPLINRFKSTFPDVNIQVPLI